MRITFKKIEIHNFMSFADEVFEFDKNIGMNLICGKNNDIVGSKNGVGKSQLFESLCFALYGQTRNNINNKNIHNKYIQGKETRVVAFFSIEEQYYKVASGFNKYGAPYCELYEIVENNEINITKSTIAETRKFLENEILHCDISIFLRTILLSSDQNYNFFRLRKGEKKEFIEKLFDISVFGNMYNAIHRDILNNDKEILALQNKLIVLNKSYNDYQERIDKHNTDIATQLEVLTVKVSNLNKKLDSLKLNIVKNNSEEVKKYEDVVSKLSSIISETNIKLHKIIEENSKIDIAINKLETSKKQKQKVVDKHSELLSKLCDDCKKIFIEYHNIDTYIQDINKYIAEIEKYKNNLEENKKLVEQYNTKISLMQEKQIKATNKIKILTEEFNKTNKEIQSIETNIAITEAEIHRTKNIKNPYTDLFENNKKQIEEETTTLSNISNEYAYLKFAENIVSQDTLRKFIIADLIGLLNNKIKMYLSKFGAKFNVVFDADMNYELITEGGTCEYDNFSAGERARLMIAACFAFRDFMYIRNNLSSNILILDEFIDGAIDSLAIDSILEILKNFSEIWNQNIFVISHRKEIDNSIFNNIIQIEKTNNIAKITYIS